MGVVVVVVVFVQLEQIPELASRETLKTGMNEAPLI